MKPLTMLCARLLGCGPSVDPRATARTRQILSPIARAEGWANVLDQSWPTLGPLFGASPYLGDLARKQPERLRRILSEDPNDRLEQIFNAVKRSGLETSVSAGEQWLRTLKSEVHLLTAIADVGGVWSLMEVTAALSRFADLALSSAMRLALLQESPPTKPPEPREAAASEIPGMFCVALGKHGANELNYSSDIDIAVFYDSEVFNLWMSKSSHYNPVKLAARFTSILQKRTADGYVFRVDLRLRPDPGSMPIAISTNAAQLYYESFGQNWERAAFIKARVAAGDLTVGGRFLKSLEPFIWRRNLDFAAISDIQAIRNQILSRGDDRLVGNGSVDLKLGPGGIREIEFFVQTQQLILGGRHPSLRSPQTLTALHALADAGFLSIECANDLTAAYQKLRGWEHRAQMIADDQTHELSSDDKERMRVASLAGFHSLHQFDEAVRLTTTLVKAHNESLFFDPGSNSNSPHSFFVASADNDNESISKLSRMGFENPGFVLDTIRSWYNGRINATASERGRELLIALIPKLLEGMRLSGAPDLAFSRFSIFFGNLKLGVQVQAMFIARPRLLTLVIQVMTFAPRIARMLARKSESLDALLDPSFFEPIDVPAVTLIRQPDDRSAFEVAMNVARTIHREFSFRVSVQVIAGLASAREAGDGFANLADRLIDFLSGAALAEIAGRAGSYDGQVAVIALGKCGSREMTARSDLDIMTIYAAEDPRATSSRARLSAETFYARFTQRLIAALSAPTAEGELYEVDMQLRPSGTKGPVAVSLEAFEDYYLRGAEVWELLALTRARVVWSSSPCFADHVACAIAAALRRPRDRCEVAKEVLDMRELLRRERPADSYWDLKMSDGGLVDIEFTTQFLQLVNAANAGPLMTNTADALQALGVFGAGSKRTLNNLRQAWELQQNLSQLIKVALEDGASPENEPDSFRSLLASAGRATNFTRLRAKLDRARQSARNAFHEIVR